jgi:hypothetical protein
LLGKVALRNERSPSVFSLQVLARCFENHPTDFVEQLMYSVFVPGAIGLGVFAAATAIGVRRRAEWTRRKEHGLCLGCGYPLGGLARCPECGSPSASC